MAALHDPRTELVDDAAAWMANLPEADYHSKRKHYDSLTTEAADQTDYRAADAWLIEQYSSRTAN